MKLLIVDDEPLELEQLTPSHQTKMACMGDFCGRRCFPGVKSFPGKQIYISPH
jgi:hypothetical protein